ncbi:ubiquitin-associated protein 1 [Parasteatoda tepidariorum]|uniref:ubiquitin-associated protein 1 n=1 Tax=Parasteatoda tepidariorum TaxID=114398 RepID=UPI001C725E13|nr:ubiquitin-associated protein 1 [Parasteatoda tepidariorum]
MDSGGKEGASYLDGVPVKISSKFIPPRPVPLPYAYDEKLNYNILDEVYDFTLEKSVIEHHSNCLFQLEKAKFKRSPQNKSSDSGEDQPSCSSSNLEESRHSSYSNAQNVVSWSTNSILQPKPQQPLDQVSSENIPEDKVMKINLSDFENDTSSPFDYMELQTINDLEELSSVFQGINSTNLQEESAPARQSGEIPSNVSKSKSFPFPSSSKDVETGTELGRTSLPSSSYEIPRMISNLNQIEDFPNDSYLKLSQVPYISSNAGAQARPSIARVPSLLRVSKSYSDISSLGKTADVHDERERSRTPPSTFSYSVNSEETMPCQDISSNGDCCDSDLPDPYHELDNSAQEFVDSITEMGFARPQVSRAVKHLGTDEKKVVEHLCQIQALEESGYEGLEAEAALHLHDYNSDEAKQFLDLVSQFQDLGFEKKAVKKALVQNKNDWNKTIDALLT